MDFEIRRLKGEEIQAAVDVWVRARWNAQPRLEERMGYTDDQNLAFFRDVVAMELAQVVVPASPGHGLHHLDGRAEEACDLPTGFWHS